MSKGLGMGLGALLDNAPAENSNGHFRPETHLKVSLLQPSSIQPRHIFDDEALKALSASIKAQGVIQPLLVRPVEGGRYEIIAGERRWRASQMAGLTEVPVIIRELEDGKALEIAIVENVQRADLNPIDEADGYLRLVNEFNYTHEEMARVTGKSRSHITNLMRLLALPEKLKECVTKGMMSMGQARALLALSDDERLQLRVANLVIKKSLSVRETEELVRKHVDPTAKGRKGRAAVDLATRELEKRVETSLHLPVSIRQKEGVGKITIAFESQEQMKNLLMKLGA